MTVLGPALPGLDGVDLADPATFATTDLRGFWRALRDERPLHWNPAGGGRPGFWVLSRHEDITAVYRDPATFTSEGGNALVTLLAGGDAGAGRMLAVSDGARHRGLRKVLLGAFSPRVLLDVAVAVRANTRALVRDAVELGTCDFAADVAADIPMTTIADLLDVPEGDRDFLLEQSQLALSTEDSDDADELGSMTARHEILLYFGELVEARRAHPGDDVISTLTASTVGGAPLTDDDVILNCYSLIVGGDETSRLSMIDAVHMLATHPDQWRLLKDGTAGIDTAVDEVLRWASPTLHFGRTTTREVTLHDVTVPAGDVVTLWHSSANRDERVFADPEVFDLTRTPNKHIAFGFGPHFCVGSFLARIEISELLLALRDLTDGVEAAGAPRRIRSNLLTGFSALPVALHPDPAGLARPDDAPADPDLARPPFAPPES